MAQPLTEKTSLGTQRIVDHAKLVSRRIQFQDRPDHLQEVHLELLTELGEDYREIIGSSTGMTFRSTREHRILVQCVDKVCKRINRQKRHQPQDEPPVDQRSCRGSSIVKRTMLLALYRDGLGPMERLMLELLQDETPYAEIPEKLGIGRTKFFELKRKVFGEITALLSDV